MSVGNWRQSELERDAREARRNVEGWDAWIAELERMLAIATAAQGEFLDELAALRAQLGDLYRRPLVEGVDADGFTQRGPSDEARVEYEIIAARIAQVERTYNLWVAERRMAVTVGGGLDRSWSPRGVTDVQSKLAAAMRGRAFAGVALTEAEAKLTPGERLATGSEAPERTEYRARVEALRQRIG